MAWWRGPTSSLACILTRSHPGASDSVGTLEWLLGMGLGTSEEEVASLGICRGRNPGRASHLMASIPSDVPKGLLGGSTASHTQTHTGNKVAS